MFRVLLLLCLGFGLWTWVSDRKTDKGWRGLKGLGFGLGALECG